MYSGKINFAEGSSTHIIRDIWTYFFRYVLNSGYWSIVYSETPSASGVSTATLTDTITASSLDTELNLTTAGKLSALTATDTTQSNLSLVEDTDFTVDYDKGTITFLSTGAVAQNDSIQVDYTWTRTLYVLYSTGYSGDEKIYIGVGMYADSDGVNGYLEWKTYKLWQDGMSWGDTSLGSPITGTSALWEGNTDIWVFVNEQRIIFVSLIQTYYSSSYIGFGNRLLMPHEYNYPLIQLSSENSSINYASTSDSRHYIADSRIRAVVNWDNSWTNNPSIYPTQVDTGDQIQFHYPDGVNRALLPLYVGYLQLDGIYYCPAAIQSSESTITIGSDTYIIFEDVNRHAWNQFMAIKEA